MNFAGPAPTGASQVSYIFQASRAGAAFQGQTFDTGRSVARISLGGDGTDLQLVSGADSVGAATIDYQLTDVNDAAWVWVTGFTY